jgi:hypothetical protein
LLIKGKDEYADTNGEAAIEQFQTSVGSGRGMEGIARASGKTWSKTGARKKSAAERLMPSRRFRKKNGLQPRDGQPSCRTSERATPLQDSSLRS